MRTPRVILGLILIAHGVGHTLGVLAPWLGDAEWSLDSWLLADAVPEWIGMGVFGLTAAMFVLAGLSAMGLVVAERNLRWLTEVAAVVSLLALALWWGAFPTIWSKLGAIVVDLVVIAGAVPERRPRTTPRHVGPAPA